MKFIPDVSNFVEKSKQRNAQPKYSMHALELVITVLIFFGIGRLLDGKFDTLPTFTLLLGIVGATGSFLVAYYRYQTASRALDQVRERDRETARIPAPVIEEESSDLVIPQGYGRDD